MVLVRLLVPFSFFESSLSLMNTAEPIRHTLETQLDDEMVYAFPTEKYPSTLQPGEATVIDRTERSFYDPLRGESPEFYTGGVVIDQENATHYFFMMPLSELLICVWQIGVVLTACGLVASNLHFFRRLIKCRRSLCLSGCPLPVYVAEGLPSPCLFGLLRPAVYLTPEAAKDDRVRTHVLAHELTHFVHRDHIWSALRCLCLALHWYNPLVWLAVFLSKRDGELACDEGAVKRLGEDQRLAYGRTLVDMVSGRPARPTDLLSCSTTMTEGKKTIQQRIALLVKKPETKKTALFAAGAAVALAVVFTFAGGRKPSYHSYEGFTTQVEQAKAIQFSLPPTYSYGYPPIEDSELLEQVKELLLRAELITNDENATAFGFADMALSSHYLYLLDGDRQTVYCLYPMEGGPVYVLILLDDDTAGSRPLATLPDDTLERLKEVAREQQERSRAVELTAEELTWFNEEFFNGDFFNIRNQFLTSLYDRPQDIDLFELFYLGSSGAGEEERAAVTAATGENPDCSCTQTTRSEMDAALLEHTGLTLDRTNRVVLDGFTYLSEYDAYYNFHGDTNYYANVVLSAGVRKGSYVTLNYYNTSFGRGSCAVTLREMDSGWQFVSNVQVPATVIQEEGPAPVDAASPTEEDWWTPTPGERR